MELYIIYYSIIWETLNHQVVGFLNHQKKTPGTHMELVRPRSRRACCVWVSPAALGAVDKTLMATRNPGGKSCTSWLFGS